MAEDVEETIIQERLSASESGVYCVAGWLLFKLLCCNLRGLDAKVLSDFGTFNLLSANKAITLGMPSNEVDFHEKKKACGAMNHPGWKQMVPLHPFVRGIVHGEYDCMSSAMPPWKGPGNDHHHYP
jgi:hypothetical protein